MERHHAVAFALGNQGFSMPYPGAARRRSRMIFPCIGCFPTYPVPVDIVLLGIQGSGKGTQARRLAEDFGYRIVEMGGELRNIIASGSELGKVVASYIDKGNHAPLEVVVQVMRQVIDAQPPEKPLLFDSAVRNLDQMAPFDEIMRQAGRSFRCIHLTLPREVATERILRRAQNEGRTDDADLGAINRRIELFYEKTLPVIEEFKRRGIVMEIDGMGTVDEVYARLKSAIA
jgi:adenylate kinase